MQQQPNKTKFRREFLHRGWDKGVDHKGNNISFGDFALKAQSSAQITGRQIEAARRTMSKYTKRGGKIYIPIFPQKAISRKASEVPMGSGKGAPSHYVAVVRPGRIVFEMAGVPEKVAREAMLKAAHKLPIKCKFITKNDL